MHHLKILRGIHLEDKFNLVVVCLPHALSVSEDFEHLYLALAATLLTSLSLVKHFKVNHVLKFISMQSDMLI